MKRLLLITSALATAGIGQNAFAGDLGMPAKAPPPVPYTAPPPINWTGWHVGADIGGGAGDGTVAFNPFPGDQLLPGVPPTADPGMRGIVGGIHGGFDWELSASWILGFEAAWEASGIKGSFAGNAYDLLNNPPTYTSSGSFSRSLDWYTTFGPRLGLLVTNSTMFFAEGGGAAGQVNNSGSWVLNEPGQGVATWTLDNSTTRFGWFVGGGFEYNLSGSWFLRAKYDFLDLGNQSGTTTQSCIPSCTGLDPVNVTAKNQYHIGLVGVDFKF